MGFLYTVWIMTLSEDLAWRGLIKDTTFQDSTWLDTPRWFYHGVDCSADSLTIGNLAAMLLARRMIEAGWSGVLLIGGATSLVGDPGGKVEERELKPRNEVDNNALAIKRQVEQLFAGQPFKTVNNIDWLEPLGFIEFLREVGKHFSMTELMQRDFVMERTGEGGNGMSFAEFSYTLMQGYDYWYLYKNHQVELQIGGSDQWGNMLSGVPLIRKKENAEVHAMSMPLVVDNTTGRKFGKSEAGAIWLDTNRTSPYQFYQFWLNIDDDAVIDFLRIYTLLPKEEIENVHKEFDEQRSSRIAQKRLAYEVTALVHGLPVAEAVSRVTTVLFGGEDYNTLSVQDFEVLRGELPVVEARINETPIVDILVEGKLASSKSEARRFLEGSAIYINGTQFSSEKTVLEQNDAINSYVLMRRGKNAQIIVHVN